jgi:tRNA(Glu) U13 pseudouridine synthase TruD
MRGEGAAMWGNWQGIMDRFGSFPSHFPQELGFLRHLEAHPGDFLGALHTNEEQVRMWFYAYDSFLFNRKLSELIRSGEVPLALPILSSFNPQDWEPYRGFLAADGVGQPSLHYKEFPFVRIAARTTATLQKADIHHFEYKDRLAVFEFSLGKGSYATAFLMHLFRLASGLPVLPGIPLDDVDPKEFLGTGSLRSTLEKFGDFLKQREADMQSSLD